MSCTHRVCCFLISRKTHACRERIIYEIDLRFDLLCFFCFLCFTSDRKTCNNFAIVMHFIIWKRPQIVRSVQNKRKEYLDICLDLLFYIYIYLLFTRCILINFASHDQQCLSNTINHRVYIVKILSFASQIRDFLPDPAITSRSMDSIKQVSYQLEASRPRNDIDLILPNS